MSYENYRRTLEHLVDWPIYDPTLDLVKQLCPHLTEEQVLLAFAPNAERSSSVAIPSLKVKGKFHILDYKRPENGPQYLMDGGTGSIADRKTPLAYMQKAVQYAEDNWPERLVEDTWQSYQLCHIQDPTDLDEFGSPKTVMNLHLTLSRSIADIDEDLSAPESQLMEASLVAITVNKFEGSELFLNHQPWFRYWCAYCGYGLNLTACANCGYTFRDNGVRAGDPTPMPPKIVEFLQQNGHVFQMDPQLGRNREREAWEARQKRRKNT